MKTLKDFATQKDFFNYLIENKKEIIKFKKAQIKTRIFYEIPGDSTASKSLITNNKDDIESGILNRSIVANTYNWMDSHDDVHVENTFAKSISERHDDIWFLHDHIAQLDAKVGNNKSIYEKPVAWKDLNINIPGTTICLISDVEIVKALNEKFFGMYQRKEINQHSVGMIYKIITMAINDPEQKEEYAEYVKYIDRIGNKQKAISQGYFFPVKEAKLIEISCVLKGSNELTPTVENQSKNEPPPVKCDFYERLAKEFK